MSTQNQGSTSRLERGGASNPPLCLSGSGALGHTWFVTRMRTDGERVAYYGSSGAGAAKFVDAANDDSCRIWTRVKGPKRYKLVPYRAAVLDGDA